MAHAETIRKETVTDCFNHICDTLNLYDTEECEKIKKSFKNNIDAIKNTHQEEAVILKKMYEDLYFCKTSLDEMVNSNIFKRMHEDLHFYKTSLDATDPSGEFSPKDYPLSSPHLRSIMDNFRNEDSMGLLQSIVNFILHCLRCIRAC